MRKSDSGDDDQEEPVRAAAQTALGAQADHFAILVEHRATVLSFRAATAGIHSIMSEERNTTTVSVCLCILPPAQTDTPATVHWGIIHDWGGKSLKEISSWQGAPRVG